MFLFKNTKSKVKRVGMNMAVYGFAGIFVFMMLALCLPKIIANYISVLMVICSFVVIIGLLVSVVWFIYELTPYAIKKQIIKEQEINNKNIVYSCGVKIPGSLYEEVKLTKEDGVYYYHTLSMVDRFHAGGHKEKVPESCLVGEEIDKHKLLEYVAKNHSYMSTMDYYR